MSKSLLGTFVADRLTVMRLAGMPGMSDLTKRDMALRALVNLAMEVSK